MRTALICHEGAHLTNEVMARWLASFSELVGVVVIREKQVRRWKRVRREVKRVGLLRFVDVLAMRLYYYVVLARKDGRWAASALESLRSRYPPIPPQTAVLVTPSPNSDEAKRFLQGVAPDIVVARCKVILRPEIYTIPSRGTFVFHAGVCPEYRNAHGCFWALANNDLQRVGMTLLRIDVGVDTGPVYGYFSYAYDEVRESHIVISHRVVLENLDALKEALRAVFAGTAEPIDTSGRSSAAWGQPWLTRYLRWRRAARRRARG